MQVAERSMVAPATCRLSRGRLALGAMFVTFFDGVPRLIRRHTSSPEPLGGPGFRFGRFFFAISGRRASFKRLEQSFRNRCHIFNCRQKRSLIGLRRLGEPADLPHKLQRSGPDFLVCHRRLEVKKNFDISAHIYDRSAGAPPAAARAPSPSQTPTSRRVLPSRNRPNHNKRLLPARHRFGKWIVRWLM